MTRYELSNQYFDWLCDIVNDGRLEEDFSYDKLLSYLHSVEFIYLIPMDKNWASHGEDLRYRFARTQHRDIPDDDILYDLGGPCSVLEMMVAVALRCEECIMDDPSYGNRTGQWFWGMIVNLGLGDMYDRRFDIRYVSEVVDRFLSREYEPDGRGGLFTIEDCDRDLRDVEIWHQLLWYLDHICF